MGGSVESSSVVSVGGGVGDDGAGNCVNASGPANCLKSSESGDVFGSGPEDSVRAYCGIARVALDLNIDNMAVYVCLSRPQI